MQLLEPHCDPIKLIDIQMAVARESPDHKYAAFATTAPSALLLLPPLLPSDPLCTCPQPPPHTQLLLLSWAQRIRIISAVEALVSTTLYECTEGLSSLSLQPFNVDFVLKQYLVTKLNSPDPMFQCKHRLCLY